MAGPAPVAIIMGSQSDWATMRHAAETLDALGVAYEARIVSAHRTPDRLYAFAKGAKAAGFKVIIAGAGGAAHLPGNGRRHDAAAGLRRADRIEGALGPGQPSIRSSRCRPACRSGRSPSARPAPINAALLAAAVLALADEALAAAARRLASAAERGRGRAAGGRSPERDRPRRHPRHPRRRAARAHDRACGRPLRPRDARLRPRARTAPPSRSPAGIRARPTTTRRRSLAFADAVDVDHLRVRERPAPHGRDPRPRASRCGRASSALATTQDRFAEKSFVAALGIATAPFRAVGGEADLAGALAEIGRPAVLKTRRFGYDGKGQVMIRPETCGRGRLADACAARRASSRASSPSSARSRWWRPARPTAASPPSISATTPTATTSSTSPACRPASRARPSARRSRSPSRIAEALDYVGVLAVEMFVVRDGGEERSSSTRSRRASTIPAIGRSRAP